MIFSGAVTWPGRWPWRDAPAAIGLAALVLGWFGTTAIADGWTSYDDPAFVWFVHRRFSPGRCRNRSLLGAGSRRR